MVSMRWVGVDVHARESVAVGVLALLGGQRSALVRHV